MSERDEDDSRRANHSPGGDDNGCYPVQSTEVPVRSNSVATSVRARPSSSQGLRRHLTRRLTREIQNYQQSHNEAVASTEDILRWDDGQVNRFKGLTPPPLTPELLPGKKRSIRAILGDNSPPRKDKMSEEIDKIMSQVASSPSDAIRPDSQFMESDQASSSHQQKKIKFVSTARSAGPSDRAEGNTHQGHGESSLDDQQSEHTRGEKDDNYISSQSR
ncbi:hypothetical protein F4779DRAFT_612705 [Xylariaceae sp. FL0662B]|nr:hypothetical protein F4779DRAFT_612705 [Xylariaceae sp. FL0662B]